MRAEIPRRVVSTSGNSGMVRKTLVAGNSQHGARAGVEEQIPLRPGIKRRHKQMRFMANEKRKCLARPDPSFLGFPVIRTVTPCKSRPLSPSSLQRSSCFYPARPPLTTLPVLVRPVESTPILLEELEFSVVTQDEWRAFRYWGSKFHRRPGSPGRDSPSVANREPR